MVGAVVMYFTVALPTQTQTRKLKQEALTLESLSRASGDQLNARQYTVWLEQFYGLLPPTSTAPDSLRAIFAAAAAHALVLEQGEYKLALDRNRRLATYEIALPVRGTYVQIRKFTSEVLERIPALALDQITIKREAIGDPGVDASLRFTLFLNGG